MYTDINLFIFISFILLATATTDILYHKIYNILTVPPIVFAITYLGITHGLNGVLFSLKGIGVGMGILIIPYILRFVGAGDVKLIGAVGAALGPAATLISYIYSAIFGGIFALIIILSKVEINGFQDIGSALKNSIIAREIVMPQIKLKTSLKKAKICNGVPIAIGTFMYMTLHFLGYQIITF